MEERETARYYAIPANYTDSGRLFGGMLAVRNAIEAVIIVVTLAVVEIKFIPMPTMVRVIVMVLTIMPSAVLSMMGIDGESLTQYLGHMFKYFRRKRKLHYRRKEPDEHGRG